MEHLLALIGADPILYGRYRALDSFLGTYQKRYLYRCVRVEYKWELGF